MTSFRPRTSGRSETHGQSSCYRGDGAHRHLPRPAAGRGGTQGRRRQPRRAQPYRESRAWDAVEHIALDRAALEPEDRFGAAILAIEPEIVIDMICFTLPSVTQLHAALAGRVSHYLCVGTIWTYGHSCIVPTPEHAPKRRSATTVSARRRSSVSCSPRPARRAFPRRSFTRGTSSDRAGCR